MSIILNQLPKDCHFRFRVSIILFPLIFRQPANHIVESVFFVRRLYVYFHLSFQSELFLYRRLMSGMDTSFSFSPFTLFSLFSLYSSTVNNSRRFLRFNSANPHHAHRSRCYPAPAFCVMRFAFYGDMTSSSGSPLPWLSSWRP